METCRTAANRPELSTTPGSAGDHPFPAHSLAEILTEAEKKHAQAAPLLGVMAAVREEQGKFQEAEAIYRELLQKNRQFIPALNNLAVLLALGGRQLDEARDLIENAVALEGPNSSLLDMRATVYLSRVRPTRPWPI